VSHESNVSGTLYVRDRADYRPATPQEIIAAARGALSRRFRRGSSLESPAAVRDYLRLSLTELGHEVFCMILLDLCGALRYVVLSRFNIGFIDRVSRRTQH
jgi:DNA repair protein RadC